MIRIDYNNRKIISANDICVHDAAFKGLEFDYMENRVEFKAWNNYNGEDLIFTFDNVLGLEVQCCDFWRGGINITGWILAKDDEYSLINKFVKLDKETDFHSLKLTEMNKFIEVVFVLNSGDTIRIACEHILIEIE